ncbi:MAG: DUF3362 domain-containing protein, partial [Acutalibacteraceae bacterium]
VFVPKTPEEKRTQRALLQYFKPENREIVLKALKVAGRYDLIGSGPDCLINAPVRRPSVSCGRNSKGDKNRRGKKPVKSHKWEQRK